MAFATRVSNALSGHVPVKPHLLRNWTGVISFTFDDCPKTSLSVGGKILARHECPGTFYVAGGLTYAHENDMACHSLDDLRGALRDGHELASHGFSHARYSRLGRIGAIDDIDRNTKVFEDRIGIPKPAHFSYPFGERSIAVKRLLGKRFVTARGIRGGRESACRRSRRSPRQRALFPHDRRGAGPRLDPNRGDTKRLAHFLYPRCIAGSEPVRHHS